MCKQLKDNLGPGGLVGRVLSMRNKKKASAPSASGAPSAPNYKQSSLRIPMA